MSKFYEHNQRFELKKMIRWEVGILKVKTGILRSTLAAFARARAAGKNETEACHARAKAEADIALSLPAEYRD